MCICYCSRSSAHQSIRRNYSVILNCPYYHFLSHIKGLINNWLISLSNLFWQFWSIFLFRSTGLFVFLYALFYYFKRSNMSGALQTIEFFGYTFLTCYVFFLMLGTVSFFASLHFVRYIYVNLKMDWLGKNIKYKTQDLSLLRRELFIISYIIETHFKPVCGLRRLAGQLTHAVVFKLNELH